MTSPPIYLSERIECFYSSSNQGDFCSRNRTFGFTNIYYYLAPECSDSENLLIFQREYFHQPFHIKNRGHFMKFYMWESSSTVILSLFFFIYLTTICVNDRVYLRVCLCAIFSRTARGMEAWMVPCCHKLSGACFNPLMFTKSHQKLSKKPKVPRAM